MDINVFMEVSYHDLLTLSTQVVVMGFSNLNMESMSI